MTDVHVSVRPTQGGWMLVYERHLPLVFLSGGRAEAGAHRLGQSLATAGSDALVRVHDRSGKVIGETRYRRDTALASASWGNPSPGSSARALA